MQALDPATTHISRATFLPALEAASDTPDVAAVVGVMTMCARKRGGGRYAGHR